MMGCGDGVLSEGELCDGYSLGDLTCRDVPGNDPQGNYKGKPACNLTCDGLRVGTCELVTTGCGNGFIDAAGEICDGNDLGTLTCRDVPGNDPQGNYSGKPACNAACDGLTAGTCKAVVAGCGDGTIGNGEICDGNNLGNLTCRDVSGNDPQGNYTGKPACNDACDGLTAGTCKAVVAGCGDGTIGDGEICDGNNLGDLTCLDVSGNDPQGNYSGKPACNATCDGLTAGTCKVNLCGNGIIDTNEGEICDEKDGEAIFVGSASCEAYFAQSSYSDYTIKEGGKPGCTKDCKKYSRGTCALAAQAMFGVEQCLFESLEVDSDAQSVTVYGRVVPKEGITQNMVHGKVACGDRNRNPTYEWGTVAADVVDCADCAEGEYQLKAEFSYALKSPGDYDCVFQTDVDDGTASTEYLNCPIEMGVPVPQTYADASIIRSYNVPPRDFDKDVIAFWGFDGFAKNDRAKVVTASEGEYAAVSTIRLSTDKEMEMMTKSGDSSDAMASSLSGWSYEDELDTATAKHFVITTKTAGFSNVAMQFTIAGSGAGTLNHVTVYANVGGNESLVGETMDFEGERALFMYGPAVVANNAADDAAGVVFRIYVYGANVSNRIRIDDIAILGDKKDGE